MLKRIWIDLDAYEALKNGELCLEAKGESPILVTPVDTVYFVEKILGLELRDYQKKLLRSLANIDKNAKVIYGRNGLVRIISSKNKEVVKDAEN